ncbi:MAG TPA: DNA-protecting protein DprA [candidate division WOR-3 bacterium]|uniref:DNA-protecting protein DprA n=1 Tax=candidate division WOR-3 bacterium TaxID=2052148 RepID=A0A7C0ZG52_UNCW3|nr:DNA-protecting protein DprA [candidate division WOR-3 bacterium]
MNSTGFRRSLTWIPRKWSGRLLALSMSTEKLLLKLSISRISPANIREYLYSIPGEEDINKDSIRDYLSDYVDVEKVLNLEVEPIYNHLKKKGVNIVSILSDDYPENLKTIPKPPPILFIRGEIVPEDSKAVAIIGTRRPTEYGRSVAWNFAKELASNGFTIISGLAMGIDTNAHRGALEAGGRTIGVIGCGIDRVYPSSNKRLAQMIADGNGAVISDFPPGTPPLKYNFPLRNRIISGLAKGIVAVQAASRSGVFSTVNWALDYGRDVFAVPGNITARQSEGTNRLIKDGAIPVTSPEDILNYFGFSSSVKEEKEVELPGDEQRVFDAIGDEGARIEEICDATGFKPQQVNSILLLLELKGFVREIGGGRYIRNKP